MQCQQQHLQQKLTASAEAPAVDSISSKQAMADQAASQQSAGRLCRQMSSTTQAPELAASAWILARRRRPDAGASLPMEDSLQAPGGQWCALLS